MIDTALASRWHLADHAGRVPRLRLVAKEDVGEIRLRAQK